MPAAAPPVTKPAAIKLAALGERIRSRRKALKVSAVDAAEAAGMSRVTLHRVEAGEPSVAMAAYIGAATAVGLELELVDPRERSRGKRTNAREGKSFPARIRLADYPQLQRLAWQLHGVTTLTPEEALGLYERNWRHVDTAGLAPAERALVNALVQQLGGGRLLV
ncbi:MAG: helix-turn-helix domain-containing protein [Burkholderiales bacterium]|nr:helix-turn-helix domain-containing protein [Burkholderiales bacterium]